MASNGYVKLIDFGLSKQFKKKEETTFTFAGSIEYLSPEILLGCGHNKNVDFWTLGILAFELAAGFTPFCDNNGRNFEKIQSNILHN